MKKKRVLYIITIIIIIILGLLSREIEGVPLFMGDIFWAMMVFFILAFMLDNKSSYYILVLSIIITYIIEITQLYHRPWIDNFRSTSIGHILLGRGFLWSDLVAYLEGIIVGHYINTLILSKLES
jgi:uncharacterized membrane protein